MKFANIFLGDNSAGFPVLIANEIKRLIAAGELTPGASLLSHYEISERLGVSRGTVWRAFVILRSEGVISTRKGSGSLVLATATRAA